MNHTKSLGFTSRLASFRFALCGFARLVAREPNMQLHLAAAVVASITGLCLRFTMGEWTATVFSIGLVWATEAINTAIELLCDMVCGGQYHPRIKVIKDIAAAAVLITAVASVLVFTFILIHKC